MKPEPMRKYRTPTYPTREEVLRDPDLLTRHLPPGWRLRRDLTGAATLFLAAGLAGCSGDAEDAPESTAREAVAIVAPIFVHGEGRGATGCVAVAPPVFLSEEEALVLIEEELGRHGIDLTDRAVPFPGIEFPARRASWREVLNEETGEKDWLEETITVEGTGPYPLELDAIDPEKRVGYEFISREDYFALGGVDDSSSAQYWDFQTVAGGVVQRIESDGDREGRFGVFYDPCETTWREEDPELSRQALRDQVKDFVDWLKAQGAI